MKSFEESLSQAQTAVKNMGKKLQESVEIQATLKQFQLLQVQMDPYSIEFMSNPSLTIQIVALRRMRGNIKGKNESCFPKNTLFYEIHQNNVENAIQIIESEKVFFQNPLFFEVLMEHISTTKKEWISPVLEALAPLTKEQEQVWKTKRLLNLF